MDFRRLIIGGVVLLVFGLLADYLWRGVDWYSFGDAQPPRPVELDTSLLMIQEIHLNGETFEPGVVISPGRKIGFSGMMETDVDYWRWNSRVSSQRGLKKKLEAAKKQKHKPSMNVELELLARTWHSPGDKVGLVHIDEINIWRTRGITKNKIADEVAGLVTFSTELWTPDRQGDYELRATLQVRRNSDDLLDADEYVIGSWPVTIRAEKPK